MANAKTINGTVGKNNYEFYVELSESWNSSTYSQTNKTTVSYAVYIKNHGTRTDSGNWTFSASYDGVSVYNATGQNVKTNDVSADGGVKQLFSGSFDVTHNDDGAKTISFSASISKSSYTNWDPGYCSASGNYALTTIPRYATVTSSYNNLTETSVKISWSSDANIEIAQYRLNGGSWVNAQTGLNTKSGNYTITGLSANTNYTIDFDYKRKDSGLWSYGAGKTNSISVKTYQYPYVNSITTANLKIGNSQKVNLYNPLGRNVTVYMKKNNTSGTQLYSGNTTSTSLTFTPNATTLNNSIPNATSGNAVYYCTYSSQTVQTKSGTYYIDNSGGTYNPTFTTSNWSYSANYTNLTNNHTEVVISGKSTITFTIGTSATAKNGATITSYKVEWGSKSAIINGTTGSATLTGDTNNILKITAIDSRGYNTPSQLSLGSNLISYFNQTLNGSTERDDGIDTDTKLSFNGTFFNNKFGTNGVQNAIQSVKYYTSTNNSSWSSAYTIPTSELAINENNYSLSDYQIHLNGTSGGFPIGTRYYVKVDIQDKMQTQSFTGILVTDGKIAVDCYQDSNGDYHRGINGLASDDCNQLINGKERVTQSIMIPKNSSDGYGLTNSDGTSIIRDHNNQNVTVNATGKTLFLGYQTTTDINILHSKATIDANGVYNGTATNATTWNGLTDDHNTANTTATYIPVYVNNKMQHTERAIWNSKQHTNFNTHQDYLATLSTLSYWSGAYNSSNASNLTYCYNGMIQCRPTILYDNASGTTGTVTLSQTAADFTYLEIFFGADDRYTSMRIYSPNGKSFSTHFGYNGKDNNRLVYLYGNECSISAKKITQSYARNIAINTSNTIVNYGNTLYTKIYAVVGWK